MIDNGRDLLEMTGPRESRKRRLDCWVGAPDFGARAGTGSVGASAFGWLWRGSTVSTSDAGSGAATDTVADRLGEMGPRIERSLTLGLQEDLRGFKRLCFLARTTRLPLSKPN